MRLCGTDPVPDRFIELHQTLLALIAPDLRKALRSRRYSDVLSFISLLKRSVSTVAACKVTLEAVHDRFRATQNETAETQESRKQRLRTLRDLNRTLERFGTVGVEQEVEQQTLEVEDLAQQLLSLERQVSSEARHIRRYTGMADALDDLIRIAESTAGQDPKLSTVVAQVQAIRATEPRANVLIYTEYTDSQAALVTALQSAGVGPVVTMSGEDDEKTRATVTDRFRKEENLLLVSTDATAEGLNLHQRCHHLLHLELPFNPNPIIALDHVIDEYRDHLQSEFRARDRSLRGALEGDLDRPLFLPQEPFYQAHRPFRAGQRWTDLPLDPALARAMVARSNSETAFLHQAPRQCILRPTFRPVSFDNYCCLLLNCDHEDSDQEHFAA